MHAGNSVRPSMLQRQQDEGHCLQYTKSHYENVQEEKTIWETMCYINQFCLPQLLHLVCIGVTL